MDEPGKLSPSHGSQESETSLPTGTSQRGVADRLLGSLERLVQRHRSLALYDAQNSGLHAELIAAELAHELAMARRALYGQPYRR
jgi:hypothetical protein